jgi:hypothetical protein
MAMSQVFTACVRRTKEGSFLPYVDVVDAARRMEWEELHPAGGVRDEAEALALANPLAAELHRGDPVPSPGERYRRTHEGNQAHATAAHPIAGGFATRLDVHERLLSGDRHREHQPEPA